MSDDASAAAADAEEVVDDRVEGAIQSLNAAIDHLNTLEDERSAAESREFKTMLRNVNMLCESRIATRASLPSPKPASVHGCMRPSC